MKDSLKDFQIRVPDWRQLLKRNRRRTFLVMLTFVLIYLAPGFFVDLYLRSQEFPTTPLSIIAQALLHFKLTPYAMLITGAIALISIWITITFSNRLMLSGTEYRQITPENATSLQEKQLYNIIEEIKVAAGLRYMPKVYIINADYMNAFASGFTEKSAMVAITYGLLQKLDRAELQAVMAHEVSHIRHMDIKLTLMASVLANLMLMVVDVLFYSALFSRDRRREGSGGNWLVIAILMLRYLLPLITIILILFLSRTREYMADAGCVELTRDNEPLARALIKIQNDTEANQLQYSAEYQSTPNESVRRKAYFFDPTIAGIQGMSSFSDLFSTHPNIIKRLAAIGIKIKP